MLGDCNGQAFAVMVPLKVVVDASRPRDLPVMRLIVSSLSACVVAYLIFLPFSARLWKRKYGTLTIDEDHPEGDDAKGNAMDRAI